MKASKSKDTQNDRDNDMVEKTQKSDHVTKWLKEDTAGRTHPAINQ